MFYYSLKNISPQKQTKKVFKSIRDVPSAFNNISTATDYNVKATELNEQKKGFYLYIYLIFISVLSDFLIFFLIFSFELIKYNTVNIAVARPEEREEP